MLAVRTIWISVVVVALLLVGSGRWAQAQNAPSNQEILDKMKAMEERIKTLEQQLDQKNAAPAPVVAPPTSPAPIGTPTAAPPTTPGTQPLAQSPPSSATAPS